MLTSEYSRAISLLKSGDAKEAAFILTRIVDRFPRYAAAQVALATALSKTGGAPQEALLQWSKAEALLHGSESVRSGFRLAAERVFAESVAPASYPGVRAETRDLEEAAEQDVEPLAHESPEPQQSQADVLGARDPDFEGHRQAEQDYGEEPEWEDGAATSHSRYGSGIDPTTTAAPDADDAPERGTPLDLGTGDTESLHAADQPEWQESGATPSRSHDEGQELPEWESSSAESGDGSDADFDINLDASGDDVELDRLIDELETARIVPRPDLDAVPEPDLTTDIEDVVSETLARIYATQKQYGEAARVYDRLALENPDRAGEFADKAAEMRRRL